MITVWQFRLGLGSAGWDRQKAPPAPEGGSACGPGRERRSGNSGAGTFHQGAHLTELLWRELPVRIPAHVFSLPQS